MKQSEIILGPDIGKHSQLIALKVFPLQFEVPSEH